MILNQKKTIRYHVFLAGTVLVIGCSILSVSFVTSDLGDTLKLFLEIGGGFISTVSAFSINKIIVRLNRINTLTMFKVNLHQFSPEELRKVEDVFWDAVK